MGCTQPYISCTPITTCPILCMYKICASKHVAFSTPTQSYIQCTYMYTMIHVQGRSNWSMQNSFKSFSQIVQAVSPVAMATGSKSASSVWVQHPTKCTIDHNDTLSTQSMLTHNMNSSESPHHTRTHTRVWLGPSTGMQNIIGSKTLLILNFEAFLWHRQHVCAYAYFCQQNDPLLHTYPSFKLHSPT